MTCPKCRSRLSRAAHPRVYTCEGCGGLWADAGGLADVIGTETDLRSSFQEPQPTDLRCPRGCSVRLEAVGYSKLDTSLLLDRCPVCAGIFLEAGELEQVIALNERIRSLFGEGTFTRPAAEGPGLVSSIRRLFRKR